MDNKLKCDAVSCVHNLSHLCGAAAIEVHGGDTQVGQDTFCSTYAHRSLVNYVTEATNMNIGGAIAQATTLLDSTGYRPARRVIDISGDGESTDGPLLAAARAAAIRKQIMINGLPVCTGGNLSLVDYYRDSVIGGVGAFLVVALGYDNFGEAILNKLVVEIAGRSIPGSPRVVARNLRRRGAEGPHSSE